MSTDPASVASPFAEYDKYVAMQHRILGIRAHTNQIVREPTLMSKIVQKYRNKQNAAQWNTGSGYIPSMCAIGAVYKAYRNSKKSPIDADGTLPDEAVKKLFEKKYEPKKQDCVNKNAKPKRKLNAYTQHMKKFRSAGWAMESAAYVYKLNKTRKTPIQSSDHAARDKLEKQAHKGVKQLSQGQLKRLGELYGRLNIAADMNNRMRSYHSMIIFRAYRKTGWSPKAVSMIFRKVADSSDAVDSLPLPMEFPQKWQMFAADSYSDTIIPIRRGRVQKKRIKKMEAKLSAAAKNERKSTDEVEFEQDLTGL
jgi:hypothetical protein